MSCKLIAIADNTTGYYQHVFEGSATASGDEGHAFYSARWAYDGWNDLNFITEEFKNPKKGTFREQ